MLMTRVDEKLVLRHFEPNHVYLGIIAEIQKKNLWMVASPIFF